MHFISGGVDALLLRKICSKFVDLRRQVGSGQVPYPFQTTKI